MKETNKLREQSILELKALDHELNAALFTLRCNNSVQKNLEKPHLLKVKRRERARVLTILREKEQEVEK